MWLWESIKLVFFFLLRLIAAYILLTWMYWVVVLFWELLLGREELPRTTMKVFVYAFLILSIWLVFFRWWPLQRKN